MAQLRSKMLFNPLEHPACLEFPVWLKETAWAEHIPFAMYVVSALRPRVLVELGTASGVSYCAFCQTVKSIGSDTRCYAVDTWLGDAHAGQLPREVLAKLRAHHDPLYADFSELIESTFDNAREHFADGTIDLLHIDGFHTYEAVSHDFETWLPKMSAKGVVLFHDTNVRERDFGVWRLWEELSGSGKYPTFEFIHGHGLGVLATGKQIAEQVRFLFEANGAETRLIREFFYQLGSRIGAIESQQTYINNLRTYEDLVKASVVMRAYRVLKVEGVKSLSEKASKRLLGK
jgi:hypothetical protein